MSMRSMQRGTQSTTLRALAVAIALSGSLAAHGVAIDTGDGSGNTSAPVDDFGFETVGVASNRSGVYLGDGWVLTADHVNEQPITFLGLTYLPIAGSGVQLENESGNPPDLFVYRIDGFPPVKPAGLASEAPALGEEVFCAGNGLNRAASSTQWNVNWETSPPPYVYEGYESPGGRTKRWGRNELSVIGIDVEIGSRTTRAIETVFDENGVPDEAQAWTGDSGGGCFAKRSGVWELVGVMFAQGTFGDPNGPTLPPPAQPSNTAVYDNTTVVADVFFFRDQIEALTPAPVPALSRSGALMLVLLLAALTRASRFPVTRGRR